MMRPASHKIREQDMRKESGMEKRTTYRAGTVEPYFLRNPSASTVSVGVYPVKPNGKNGKAVLRVKGPRDDHKTVSLKAENIALSLSLGRTKPSDYPKTISVGAA